MVTYNAAGQTVSSFLVDDNISIEDAVKSLQGPGTLITNITYALPGDGKMIGTFEDTEGQLGLSKGLLMTTGQAKLAIGPNDIEGATASVNANPTQNTELESIIGWTGPGPAVFYDVVIIEFDIKATSNNLNFNYMFGSEEYSEWIGSFNDVFGFFISGPGITGSKNIATLENGDPVSVNTINIYTNDEYYIPSGEGYTPEIDYYLQYDGRTRKMVASADIIPNETYHIKLIIADFLDFNYDSGVFLEGESFVSIPYSLEVTYQNEAFDHSIEDCNKAYVTIKRAPNSSDLPLDLNVSFFGEAKNGEDFDLIESNALSLAQGQLSATVEINAISDGVEEGDENLFVKVTNDDTDETARATIVIKDKFNYVIDPSVVCKNKPTPINTNASVDYSFNWISNTDLLSCARCASPSVVILDNKVFDVVVKHNASGCENVTSAQVDVYDFNYPFVNEVVCRDVKTQINTQPLAGYNFAWPVDQSLSCFNCPSPFITPKTDLTLDVEIEEVSSGCKIVQTLIVDVSEISAYFEYAITDNYSYVTLDLQNLSTGASEYSWKLNDDNNAIDQFQPSLEIIPDGQLMKISLTAISTQYPFCESKFDSLISIRPSILVPNIVTPNNDDYNQYLIIKGIETAEWSLQILNKWGTPVHFSRRYLNDWSGEGLNSGVYYYILQSADHQTTYKGWVHLVK